MPFGLSANLRALLLGLCSVIATISNRGSIGTIFSVKASLLLLNSCNDTAQTVRIWCGSSLE